MTHEGAQPGARAGAQQDARVVVGHSVAESATGAGVCVAVVGPSGAGKDTVLGYARGYFAKRSWSPVFVRRRITRRPSPGEEHLPITEAEFARVAAAGGFALTWQAHGLAYGVPASTLEDVAGGAVVVVNVSRTVLSEMRARYPRVLAVEVTVSPEVRAARISSRGREVGAAVIRRLERPDPDPSYPYALTIVNDGTVAEAGGAFVRFLSRLRPSASL